MPIAFSDSELETLMTLAMPLPPSQRGPYLQAIAELLAQHSADTRGPGLVHRLGVDLQRQFLHAPPNLHATARSRRS